MFDLSNVEIDDFFPSPIQFECGHRRTDWPFTAVSFSHNLRPNLSIGWPEVDLFQRSRFQWCGILKCCIGISGIWNINWNSTGLNKKKKKEKKKKKKNEEEEKEEEEVEEEWVSFWMPEGDQ